MVSLQIIRLAEHHLDAIVAIERALYPPPVQESTDLIRARLQFEDRHCSSLNLGLFAGDRLVGYILAHLDDGVDFHEHGIGENIYVADIAVLPSHRRQLLPLLVAFAREVRLEYPGRPVVAHAIHGTERGWTRHGALIRRLGGTLVTRIDNVVTEAGAPASLLVWQTVAVAAPPAPEPAPAVPPAESYPTSAGQLGVRVIDNEDDLLALATDWRQVEALLPDLTVFQTFRYQAAWVRSFALPRQLLVIAIYAGNELIGLAPLQVARVELHHREFRQVTFLGAPWEVDRPAFLFPRDPAACAEAAARALLARRRQWDFIWFHEQHAGDPALEAFCTTLRRNGLLHGRSASSRCPYLSLAIDWPELLAGKSAKFRKNLKAARRKLEAAGRVEYRTTTADRQRLRELLLEFELLEQHSWKSRAGIGITQSVEHRRFYRLVADRFGATGDFVFRDLRIDGRLIAATFGIVHHGRYYSLHIASDSEFARHSAGTYLEALELEDCCGSGLEEYDFLGGFLQNKLRWTSTVRDTVAVHLYQRRPWLVALFIAYFLVKAPLKRLLARVGIRWKARAPENQLRESVRD